MANKFVVTASVVLDVDLAHFEATSIEGALEEQIRIFEEDPASVIELLENSSADDLCVSVEIVDGRGLTSSW